jgi:DNA-binding LacI/PurR family transcriptional regulator
LDDLERMGVITSYKRSFRPVRVGTPPAGAALMGISVEDGNGRPKVASRRDGELLGALEEVCTQRGLRPALVGLKGDRYDLTSSRALKLKMTELSRRGPVLGAIVRIAFIRGLDQLLEYLLSQGLNVVTVDEFGDLTPESAGRFARRLSVLNVSYPPTAGRAAGLFLTRKGHRHAAYFTNFSRDRWSRNRLLGLRETFRTGRPDASVSYYSTPAEPSEAVTKRVSGLTGGPGADASPPGRRLREVLRLYRIREGNRARYEQVFDQALGTDATAWVCDNDLAGIAALDFLETRGVAVPERIAVMGFDNTAEALRRGLTSYDFAIPRLAEMMVRYATEGTKTREGGEDLERYIVERGSTGAVGSD